MRLNGRKNIGAIFLAWMACETLNLGSLRTDGRTVWSYATPLLTRGEGTVYLNDTSYTATTTTHQRGLTDGLRELAGIEPTFVKGIPFGADPEALEAAA